MKGAGMTTTRQKLTRICRNTLTALAVAITVAGAAMVAKADALVLGPCPESGGPPGAVFTSDLDCKKVNGNIYALKTVVYLNGGSKAADRLDGNYYVRVLSPMGTLLGQSSGLVAFSPAECLQLWSIVIKASDNSQGYDDTDNNGGEYKVEVSCDAGFLAAQTKSDNFKVRASVFCVGAGCPLAISCPLDVDAECEGINGAHVTYEDPIVIGGTAPYLVVCSPASGWLFPTGPTLVTCNVTDSSDPQQSDSCSFTVTVPDSCPGTCEFSCGTDVPAGCGNSLVDGLCCRSVDY